ncbi:MAG TPA: hypothetical protein VGJ26_08230 [Pirellulales bacterium]|jgi:hypothetical protein
MTQTTYRGRWPIVALVIVFPLVELGLFTLERLADEDYVPLLTWAWPVLNPLTLVWMHAQGALPALWLAWGTRFLVARVAVFCAVPFVGYAQSALATLWPFGNEYDYSYAAIPYWIEAILLVLMASTMRLAGFRLQRFTPEELDAEKLPTRRLEARDYHFPLRNVFVWTAIVAVLCALGRLVVNRVPWESVDGHNLIDFLLSEPWEYMVMAIESIVTLVIGWAMLTARRFAPRIVIAGIVSAGTIIDQYIFNGDPDWNTVYFIGLFVLVLSASLYVFRRAGYRLLWRAVRAEDAAKADYKAPPALASNSA